MNPARMHIPGIFLADKPRTAVFGEYKNHFLLQRWQVIKNGSQQKENPKIYYTSRGSAHSY